MIAFVLVAVVAYRMMTPDARTRTLTTVVEGARLLNSHGRPQLDTFRGALRDRTPQAYATYVLTALNVALFIAVLFGKGAISDPATLVAWGANTGPRTTNGEWWRLLTSSFVHDGFFSLLIETAALVQVGLTLERLIGPFAFTGAYAAAATAVSLVALATIPLGVTFGSAGAVLGLYAVLIAFTIRSRRSNSILTMPPVAALRMLPVFAVFLLHALVSGAPGAVASLAAAGSAAVFALAVVRDVTDEAPAPRRVAAGFAAALVVAAGFAVPMRGISDVRPELDRLVKVERSTSDMYQTAAARFKNGAMTAAALAGVIDKAIVPELQAADDRIAKINGVPHEDLPRVADAREYIRLRCESWRLRAAGLRGADAAGTARDGMDGDSGFHARAAARYRSTTLTFGRAESAERKALEALQRTH